MTSRSTWLVRLAAVTALFGLVALWRSTVVDVPFRDPNGGWLQARIWSTVTFLIAFIVLDTAIRTLRESLSIRGFAGRFVTVARTRWTWSRTALTVGALACYALVYFFYRNLKSWDVLNEPRDEMLTRVDLWLFFGNTPAELLHGLLGTGVSAWVLIFLYQSFSTLVKISVVAAITMRDRIRDGAVFVASMSWGWILGIACYYAIPSLGPFDDRPQDFADLPESVVTRNQELYMDQRANFLADPQAPDAFAQVSAFASLHVGMTTIIFLMTIYYGMRRTSVVMGLYLVSTLVSTIYLGWHFFTDDVAGLALGAAAVVLGRFTIYPRHNPFTRPKPSKDRELAAEPTY